jgi:hypothetical protein
MKYLSTSIAWYCYEFAMNCFLQALRLLLDNIKPLKFKHNLLTFTAIVLCDFLLKPLKK